MSLIPFSHYRAAAVSSNGSFKLSNAYLVSDSAVSAIGTGDFTVEFWVYYISTSYVFQNVLGVGTSDDLVVSLRNNDISVEIANASVNYSDANLTENTWSHIAVVRNSNVVTVYLDGVSVGTGTQSGSIGSNTIGIGASRTDGSTFNPCRSYLTMLRFSSSAKYTSAFTADTNYGVEGDTLAFYTVTDGGSTITDLAGGTFTEFGLHLVSAGFPSTAPTDIAEATTSWEVPTSLAIHAVQQHAWNSFTVSDVTSVNGVYLDSGSPSVADNDNMDRLEAFFANFADSDFQGDGSLAVLLKTEVEYTLNVTGGSIRLITFDVDGVDVGNTDNITVNTGSAQTVTNTIAVPSKQTADGLIAGTSGIEILVREFDTNPYNMGVQIDRIQMRVTYEYKT